jgi:hypothetical protein
MLPSVVQSVDFLHQVARELLERAHHVIVVIKRKELQSSNYLITLCVSIYNV